MIMQKIGKNSHFDLINGGDLKSYGNRILQMDSEKEYTNNHYGVYICEIDDRPSVVEQNKEMLKKQ